MTKEEKEQASEGKRGQEKTISNGKMFSCNKNQAGGPLCVLKQVWLCINP